MGTIIKSLNVIARHTLNSFADGKKFASARGELELWFQVADKAKWKDLLDVQKDYREAEAVRVGKKDNYTVFNICGDKFRLIVHIRYGDDVRDGTIFIKDFLTHKDYDTDNWKMTLDKARIAREKVRKEERKLS
jgi:mRNA interferase HigB